jgi:hypothetical protein
MLSVVMLSVIMLSVIMPSVIMLSVVMLSVIMLSVVMLSVSMISVIMLNVVVPIFQLMERLVSKKKNSARMKKEKKIGTKNQSPFCQNVSPKRSLKNLFSV